MTKSITLLSILLALASTAAFADRDIVYSARYYTPPGSRVTSHFHLYRINPDGSGKTQITSGPYDDENPQWSPDGKSILFIRNDNYLCTVDPDGRKVRKLAEFDNPMPDIPILWDAIWHPNSRAVIVPAGFAGDSLVLNVAPHKILDKFEACFDISVSPDGRRAFLNDDKGGSVAKLRADGHVDLFRALPVKVVDAAWVSDDAFVGIIQTEGDASDQIIGFNDNGTRLWTRDVHPVRPVNSDLGVSFARVVAIPSDFKDVILAEDAGTSTVRPNYNYYRASVDTGDAPLWLSSKQWVHFAQSGAYVTSSAKGLSNYGPKKHGRQPQVWTSDLEIGRTRNEAHPKPIVHGLVWVDSADWRR